MTEKWVKECFDNIHPSIEKAEKEEEIAEKLNKNEDVKLAIKGKLELLYKPKVSMLCQISRVDWKLNGKKWLFHKAIDRRRKSNTIIGIQIEDEWIINPGHIKEGFYPYYSIPNKTRQGSNLSNGK